MGYQMLERGNCAGNFAKISGLLEVNNVQLLEQIGIRIFASSQQEKWSYVPIFAECLGDIQTTNDPDPKVDENRPC